MSAVQVQCPSCGGIVVFKIGTGAVAICPHCRSVVARGDRKVEDLGKVAAVVESGAVLKLGLTGHYNGVKFDLVGRTQMKHSAGGVWDEWYAAFPNGRWGWLAEAQGRFYLTFAVPEKEATPVPPFDQLKLDDEVTLPGAARAFIIHETGTATVAGAEGEIPWRVTPGTQYAYADLTGDDNAFATLDYADDPPAIYVGRQVTLDEIGIPLQVKKQDWELRKVAGKKLSCPQCGGALDLRAPDKTERVGCPYCGALLEARDGDLAFLTKPEQLKRLLKPALELGATGKFGDAERQVIGILRRSVTFDKVDYFWDEFLLYHPRDGFEWLTHSDFHWNRVRNVPAAEVSGSSVIYREYGGKKFRIFQDADAEVRAVIGECYWKVSVGEKVRATDYIAPPLMLSREATVGSKSEKEVNWSLGEYLRPEEVQQAFQLPEPLPRPLGVGPNEPFRHKRVYLMALIFLPILCVFGVLASHSRTVYEHTFQLEPLPPGRTTQTFLDEQKFELKSRSNVAVTVTAPQLTGGLLLEGDLVHDGDNKTQPFVMGLGYYTGADEDGPWTQDHRSDTEFISSPGPGQYSLRLEAQPDGMTQGGTIKVKIEQGVARIRTFLFAMFALLVIPAIVAVYHFHFATQRWKDSEFSPYKNAGGGGGDDD